MRRTDERNVRALVAHLGCTLDEATRLYELARRDGYGSAYAQVFPGGRAGIDPIPGRASGRTPRGGLERQGG